MEAPDHFKQMGEALKLFKDWSNYLLVTTVAALGWVTAKDRPRLSGVLRQIVICCFGLSIVFAIFTLALTPLVAEQLSATSPSIYETPAPLYVLPFTGGRIFVPLVWVCWPQHAFFLAGIVLYVAGVLRPAPDEKSP